MNTTTIGISPKALLALVVPLVATVFAVLVQWVATGDLSRAELATALSGFGAAVTAFLGAYAGSPGNVATADPVDAPDLHPDDDDSIPDDVEFASPLPDLPVDRAPLAPGEGEMPTEPEAR